MYATTFICLCKIDMEKSIWSNVVDVLNYSSQGFYYWLYVNCMEKERVPQNQLYKKYWNYRAELNLETIKKESYLIKNKIIFYIAFVWKAIYRQLHTFHNSCKVILSLLLVFMFSLILIHINREKRIGRNINIENKLNANVIIILSITELPFDFLESRWLFFICCIFKQKRLYSHWFKMCLGFGQLFECPRWIGLVIVNAIKQ